MWIVNGVGVPITIGESFSKIPSIETNAATARKSGERKTPDTRNIIAPADREPVQRNLI
jgi:hypothetical protein